VVAVVALRAVAPADETAAPPEPVPVEAEIGDLAWIQGHWTTKFDENELHEIWSPPHADCMMASFCWIKKGHVWMYELMTMAEEGGHVVLRFKHFSREMKGWEDKDEALTFALVELGDGLAAFRNTGDGGPTWLVFHKESATRMTVRVGSRSDDDGEGFELKYERAK